MKSRIFEQLLQSRKLYMDGQFKKAMKLRDSYVAGMRPSQLPVQDFGSPATPDASVIIVAYNTGKELLACVDSLLDQIPVFEIIIVDNGSNETIHDDLSSRPIRLLELPHNVGPSEGRNLGAMAAQSDLLIFLDDDAEAAPDFIHQTLQAFSQFDFLAIRGRILPLAPEEEKDCMPGHYDLGDYPMPAILETEGAMAIQKATWDAVGGMDPMLFGAEGVDLSARLLEAFPGRDIYYWPSMIIRHDYAEGDGLARKKQRHRRVAEYFSAFGYSAAHMAIQYGRWYQERPGTLVRYDQRSLIEKIKAAFKEYFYSKAALPGPADTVVPVDETQLFSLPAEDLSREILIRRVHDYEQRFLLLEQNIETIRRSPAYRLGRWMVSFAKAPLRKGIRLPYIVSRFAIEALRRNDQQNVADGAGDISSSYTNPGREIHRCTIFPEARVYKPRQKNGAVVGCLLQEELVNCLSFNANCRQPSAQGIERWLAKKRPEVFIAGPLHDGRADMISAAYQACAEQDIPTVFWHMGDVEHFKEFKEIAAKADFVFSDDPRSTATMETMLPNYSGLLPPAVQPALHNPLRSAKDAIPTTGNTVCFDGWADLLEFPDNLAETLSSFKQGELHVLESRWGFTADKLNDLPELKHAIWGCLRQGELLNALKTYPILLQAEPSLVSQTDKAKRALEAIACGASVISAGPENLLDNFNLPNKALRNLGNDDLRSCMNELLREGEDREKAIHFARRTLFDNHTYAHRLSTIYEAAGLKSHWLDVPLATLITPTKRPHMLEKSLEQHTLQTHPSIKSLVVLNRTDCDVEAVRKLCDEKGARLIVMPRDYTIGQCLNEGIRQASGDFWFKIDDDDFYGPNYVKDTIHAWLMSGADVFGKAAGYIYFQKDDELAQRSSGIDASHVICTGSQPHMSGATFAGYARSLAAGPFPEDKRACVDSLFFEHALKREARLHMTDQFNFVAFRGQDKTQHTWRHSDDTLKSNSVKIGRLSSIEDLMI